jgi:flavin-dependent dehydrogenase
MVLKYIDLEAAGAKRINGIYMSNKNKNLLYVEQPVPAYSIERSAFDNILLNKAIELGAEIKMPITVKSIKETNDYVRVILSDGSSVESNFLVLAEGINGQLHKQLGYTGTREITMALEMNIYPNRQIEKLTDSLFFDTGSIKNGYAWMFPKNGAINTGAYFYNSQTITPQQKQSYLDFLNLFDWIKETTFGKLKGYPIPRKINYKFYNTNRSVLVGDACGAAENFFGEGIYLGLLSARFASDCIEQKIKTNLSLNRYSEIVRRRINKRVKYSRIMANFFYRNQNFCYKYLVMNSKMNKIYHQYVQGAISSSKVFYYTFLLLPFSGLSKILQEENPAALGFLNTRRE